MCKVKGCARPHFLGGLCGFHALQLAWRPPPRRAPTERRSAPGKRSPVAERLAGRA